MYKATPIKYLTYLVSHVDSSWAKQEEDCVRRMPGYPVASWDGVWQAHKEPRASCRICIWSCAILFTSGSDPRQPLKTDALECAPHPVPCATVVNPKRCLHHRQNFVPLSEMHFRSYLVLCALLPHSSTAACVLCECIRFVGCIHWDCWRPQTPCCLRCSSTAADLFQTQTRLSQRNLVAPSCPPVYLPL